MVKKYFYRETEDVLIVVTLEEGKVESVEEVPAVFTQEVGGAQVVVKKSAPIPKKKPIIEIDLTEKKPRKTKYDKEAIKADIRRGLKKDEIAARHGVTESVVKNIKFNMGKETGNVNDVFKKKIKILLEEGKDDQEIYNEMHDSMTDAQFREVLEAVKKELE